MMLSRRRKILSARLSFMTETPSRAKGLSVDALSDVLHTIRLEGAIFLNAECHEPWCVEVARGSELARVLRPQAQNLVICHTVLEGRCWVRMPDGEAVALHAGDVAAIPH